MRLSLLFISLVASVVSSGCGSSSSGPGQSEEEIERARPAPKLSARSSRPAAERVVAIGDLHGDLAAARNALRVAGAIGADDSWIGGKLIVVQTGDQIDRGDEDREVMDLFEQLNVEAKAAGGEVISLSGNHEIMNASFDFRYVNEPAFAAFDGITPTGPQASHAARFGPAKEGRASAFAPGGLYAMKLAQRPIVVRVGDSVFVHGGLHGKHATYGIDRMNDEMSAWLDGSAAAPPPIAVADDGPLWTRAFSETQTVASDKCQALGETLRKLEATRLVMGHSVQDDGINSACDGKAWRIDVGMSASYGGGVQVLAIENGAVRVVTSD